MNRKVALIFCLTIFLANLIAVATFAQTNRDGLTAKEIAQKSLDAYAALTSYSDTGKVVMSQTGKQSTTVTFDIRLQQPNLFQIRWRQISDNTTNKGYWRSDPGNNFGEDQSYFWTGTFDEETNTKPIIAWIPMALTGLDESLRDTAIVPAIFLKFKQKFAMPDVLAPIVSTQTTANITLDGGKIGGTHCYVISIAYEPINNQHSHTPGTLTQLWIGKQDYLLRQVRSTMTISGKKPGKMTLTQTHEHILLNQKFSTADFEQPHEENRSSITLHSAPPAKPTVH
jgi:hypothetical protein